MDEKYHFDINREGSGSDDIYGTDEEVSSESDKDYEVECEYNTHTPRIKWNKMKELLGERYESPHQLNLYLTNHAIYTSYKIKFKKCDSIRLVVACVSDPKNSLSLYC